MNATINEYFFGIFYFISYSLVETISSTTLMSSNVIIYLLLYQVLSYVLLLVLYD